jgi:ProP effector
MTTISYKGKRAVVKDQAYKSRPAVIEALKKRYPAIFTTRKPLKIGIRADILARKGFVDDDMFKRGIRRWVVCTEYIQLIANGGDRYDLDGNVSGQISDEDRGRAIAKIERRAEKMAKKLSTGKRG